MGGKGEPVLSLQRGRSQADAVQDRAKELLRSKGRAIPGVDHRPFFFQREGTMAPAGQETMSIAILVGCPAGRTRNMMTDHAGGGDEVDEAVFAGAERKIVVLKTISVAFVETTGTHKPLPA